MTLESLLLVAVIVVVAVLLLLLLLLLLLTPLLADVSLQTKRNQGCLSPKRNAILLNLVYLFKKALHSVPEFIQLY